MSGLSGDWGEHQVGRFQIAMHHPALSWRCCKPFRACCTSPHGFAPRQPLAPRQNLVERFAFQVLHHDVMHAVGITDLEARTTFGMVELRQQACLALETAEDVACPVLATPAGS